MRYADSHEIIIEKEPFHTAYTHNKEEQINNESEYRIADISKQKAYARHSYETRRKSETENNGEKIYLKTNRYCRWLTNRVIVKAEAEKIYLTIPREYGKYFKEIEADKTELKSKKFSNINTMLVVSVLAGAVLGGIAGLAGAAFYGTFNGYIVGMNLYRAYAAFALVGAAIGLYTPV